MAIAGTSEISPVVNLRQLACFETGEAESDS